MTNPLTPAQAVQVARRHLATATGAISHDITAGVLAEVDRLTAELSEVRYTAERLLREARQGTDRNATLERMLEEWRVAGGPPSRHRNRADKAEAVIEQVRAHCENTKTRAAQLSAEHGLSYLDVVDPGDILALLPPATQPTQEA